MDGYRVAPYRRTGFLLATVLALATAGGALAAPAAAGGILYPWTASPSQSSLPADGLSAYTITFGQPTATDVIAVSISVTGGFFLTGSGSVLGPSATLTYPRSTISLADASNVTWSDVETLSVAASTAGTATFKVAYASDSLGIGYDSTFAFTFTNPADTVSTLYSTTTVSPDAAPASVGTTATLTTTVRDAEDAVIPSGALVSWTLSGPALFAGGGQVDADNPVDASGVATTAIVSTGVAGPVTIGTVVTYLGVTYTLAGATVAFVAPQPTVPTETSQCFDGAWSGLGDGLGDWFKNQGDCVSFVATGGSNPGDLH